MHLTVELHLANGSIADKQSLPIDWTAPPHIGATVVKPEPVGAAPARATIDRMRGDEVPVNAAGSLDAEAIAALIRRADAFVELGDISAARVLLRRAAESRDPRAALALGATYDPTALAKRGVQGLVGDVTTASIWYNLAKQLGSEEAQARIDQLASQRR
jgi:TPR repeat protein